MGKRALCMMLSCVLALGLSACGKSDSSGEAENKTAVPASETADYVRSAMDAADHLYGSYLLAEDGSIITLRDTSYHDAALGYASLEGVRKLCVSPSESHTFALTEGGDLYAAGSGKIASGVSDLIFCTNNANEEGYALTDNGIRRIGGDTLGESDASGEFVRLADGHKTSIASAPTYIGVEKHHFFVLDEGGRLFLIRSSDCFDDFGELGVFDWENLAMAGMALRKDEPETLTVAGIRRDGTVVAAGEYAADILSWGSLSSLSMGDGLIVGLTREGSLKVTGQAAELVRGILEGWSDIVAVKVGRRARLGDLITAMDAGGDFYFLNVDHNAVQGATRISLESGSAGDVSCFRYAPDGTVCRSRNGGGWTAVD